jgi:hypothetical protein
MIASATIEVAIEHAKWLRCEDCAAVRTAPDIRKFAALERNFVHVEDTVVVLPEKAVFDMYGRLDAHVRRQKAGEIRAWDVKSSGKKGINKGKESNDRQGSCPGRGQHERREREL